MSVVGRFFAIIVILSGLIIFGLVTSVMTTAITTATMETESSLYGAKVQANTTCLSAYPTLENYTVMSPHFITFNINLVFLFV